MTTILWDTNGTEIVKTLAAERRTAGALASGLALTLVVVADEKHVDAAREAATQAAAAHPCRLLVVVRRKVDADDRLDAEVQVGGQMGANESVVMRMYGRLTLHAESVVLPLLASDAPVVTWWHGDTPERLAYDALAVQASRRVTDVSTSEDPMAALKRRAKDYAPGDTDLAWTRCTPWRALLASGLDDDDCGPDLGRGDGRAEERQRGAARRLADRPAGREGQAGPLQRARHHRRRGALRPQRRAAHRPARRLPGDPVAHRHVRPAAAAEAALAGRPARGGAAPAGRRPALRRRAVRGDRREGAGRPPGQAGARLARPDATGCATYRQHAQAGDQGRRQVIREEGDDEEGCSRRRSRPPRRRRRPRPGPAAGPAAS